MIELNNISKKIKNRQVLDRVSYVFEDGKVYGLYGHNGSGKTMLLRAISGLIRIDEGEIRIDGKQLHEEISFPPETGIVIENMELLPKFSAKDNLRMLAKIKKVAGEEDIEDALRRVGLDPDSPLKVKKFSLGMRQRLNIAQAIFEKQQIILLDEPTNALDEDGVHLIYDLILQEKERGATIIIATHHKEDIETLCDTTLRISDGRIIGEEGKR